jgi:hypothetical protein
MQLFDRAGWSDRLGSGIRHTSNAMTRQEVVRLGKSLDPDALIEYRNAVWADTRAIVMNLEADRLREKAPETRLQGILDDGSVLRAAEGVIEYWGKRTIAELLLMSQPAIHSST